MLCLRAGVSRMVAHEWSIGYSSGLGRPVVGTAVGDSGVGRRAGEGLGWLDTLLGPEGTDLWDCGRVPVACAVSGFCSGGFFFGAGLAGWVGSSVVCGASCGAVLLSHRTGSSFVGVGGLVVGGVGCCLLFEICIVDASIFVAKFFRAHGGCLGIRSR
jgi:hypothetical protein